jgi:hypothetical protein
LEDGTTPFDVHNSQVKVVYFPLNDTISQRDLVVSEVDLPPLTDIIDTEQNVSDAAGAGAEVGAPDLDGSGADVIYDQNNNSDSEQETSRDKCKQTLTEVIHCLHLY